MPKAASVTGDDLIPANINPSAATSQREEARGPSAAKVAHVPLQLRIPRSELKAIKIAAAQREQTISAFMLACFHACMKRRRLEKDVARRAEAGQGKTHDDGLPEY